MKKLISIAIAAALCFSLALPMAAAAAAPAATVQHTFRVVATGQEVVAPAPDNLYQAGDHVYLDKLNKGTWVTILRKQSIVINVRTENVHWDVAIGDKP